ncbi:8639_t:CDS:1, partial [Cetraspora pellucida]
NEASIPNDLVDSIVTETEENNLSDHRDEASAPKDLTDSKMTEIEEIPNLSNDSSIKDLPNQNSTAVTLYSSDKLDLIEDETECSNSTLTSMLMEENQLEALATDGTTQEPMTGFIT